jgi:hypothetical protein
MSVNLMSAIFQTEFFDLKDAGGSVTKASTAKIVLLAMADNASDDGENAYPSIKTLCRKTALSEQTIRSTFATLRHNGIIFLEGKSKLGTNDHTINVKSFPRAVGKEIKYLILYPLDPPTGTEGGITGGVGVTYPLYPNHYLTINEPPEKEKKPTARIDRTPEEQASLDKKKMDAAMPQTQADIEKTRERDRKANLFEAEMGYNPLSWWTSKDLMALLRFLVTKTDEEIRAFAAWSKRPFSTFDPVKAKRYPLDVIAYWPLAQPQEPEYTGGHRSHAL